jgi:hypothetical protein
MKHILTLLLLCSVTLGFAGQNESLTIRQQLVNLNKFWQDKNIDLPLLDQKGTFSNDDNLIQLHLFLVEQTLRANTPKNLSAKQLANRNQCLDILKGYAAKGVFPRNLYHANRQPYFIDHLGTACAVGYLVIQTGYADYAQSIHNRNNYVYIMDIKDKELDEWANKYGFAKQELAWIQPSYPCQTVCPSGEFQNPTCYGTPTGCANPDLSVVNGTPPYTMVAYMWIDTGWQQFWNMSSITCDLMAGDYKYEVTDAAAGLWTYYFNLVNPDSIDAHPVLVPDNGNCTGAISVTPEKGQPPYTYQWYSNIGGMLNFTGSTATGLCAGDYYVYITDAAGCGKYNSYKVDLTSGVENPGSISEVKLYPNPVHDKVTIEINGELTRTTCTNAIGETMHVSTTKIVNGYSINTADLAPGVYYLSLQSGKNSTTHKFIKD